MGKKLRFDSNSEDTQKILIANISEWFRKHSFWPKHSIGLKFTLSNLYYVSLLKNKVWTATK